MKLIGVDVGGTFTDIVCTDTETSHTIIHKAPTTPDDPSHGVILGVSELCERFGLVRGDIDHVLHGTTIATNAVLEYNGAVTGMVTSEGYRDILHIGRHQRPQHYSMVRRTPPYIVLFAATALPSPKRRRARPPCLQNPTLSAVRSMLSSIKARMSKSPSSGPGTKTLWPISPTATSSPSRWILATGWWLGGQLRMCMCWRRKLTTRQHGRCLVNRMGGHATHRPCKAPR